MAHCHYPFEAEAAMAPKLGLGNFINGSFMSAGTLTLTSKNPSLNFEPIFSVKTDVAQVEDAIEAAKLAQKSWSYLTQAQRNRYLLRLKESFKKNEQALALAISLEMGKMQSEALTEAKGLSARIDVMLSNGLERVKGEEFYDLRARTRYHHQGVLAVIGPYNFPAHLVNAHVIPSLLTGNCVVVKPSEICPMTAELYAQCFLEAEFPAGVYNMVQGDGHIGKALCAHPLVDGVLFTGSYPTGRSLKELLLDQPHKILALEMGGKNIAVVMDDADIEQSLSEIIQGAFLTTGQRCTATSRVLVHHRTAQSFTLSLAQITRKLMPSKPSDVGMFGPLATKGALDKFMAGLGRAREEGAEVLVESQVFEGGAFVSPSLYRVSSNTPIKGYLSEELFGPNIAIETFYNLDEAIERTNESPYGLSNAIFTLDPHNATLFYNQTKSGVLNINRSTNGAYGQMPFGGVGKSGNQRPAGIDAVFYTTFPVAISSLAFGESAAPSALKKLVTEHDGEKTPLSIITLRHSIEALFELYGINSDFAGGERLLFGRKSFSHLETYCENFLAELGQLFGALFSINEEYLIFYLDHVATPEELLDQLKQLLESYWIKSGLAHQKINRPAINVPKDLELPRSRAMLDRLYKGHFVPQEKKAPVADLVRSKGAFLVSVDDDPLVLFDAASQIATLGAGFMADTWQNAYEDGELDYAIENTWDFAMADDGSALCKDAREAKARFERFLNEKTHHRFSSIAYGAGGAEANEIAFDLCRQHGPGGTRIIAFEGAFHGRTIMALQATYNKEKRGPFAFKGYEATFLPFPNMESPSHQSTWSDECLRSLSHGEIPTLAYADDLLSRELKTLSLVKEEILKGNICCVIIEPMQCEGGDYYGSNRFFNGLRSLTRALKIPLVFDEVQTGFHLGRTFFWHEQFDLRDYQGQKEVPDCITLAKKAQLGICMSVWPNPRSYSPHVMQLKRGLMHALAIDGNKALAMEKKALKELARLEEYFPRLVKNSRACGFAFAFDMPSNKLALDLINQRFDRGFMAYIAGEKTLRFRLNMCTDEKIINSLFEKLFIALADMRDGHSHQRISKSALTLDEHKDRLTNIVFHKLTPANFSVFAGDIENLEKHAYEKSRRDTIETLEGWIKKPDSLGIVLTCDLDGQQILGGFAIGGPLEYAFSDGPAEDPMRSRNNTFYSADIAIDHRVRGMRLGHLLKEEQIKQVGTMRKSDGTPRYAFISGRNRIGSASAMTHINEAFGAYTVKIYDHQYGDENAQALYYRLPITKEHALKKEGASAPLLDCQNSVHRAFYEATPRFKHALKAGLLRTIACQKLTLSNWATTNMIRYSELLRALMPSSLRHVYFTSGRDEVVDKGLRSLRFHRPDAEIAISFSHQWLGNISAAARSLSYDEGQAQPFSFFNWPKISHPCVIGKEASLAELKALLKTLEPERVLGIIVELLGEKSGFSFDKDFLQELDALRKASGIPLVFVETTSAYGRSGRSLFLSDSLSVKPNMVWWYTGGQLGHVMVDDHYFVEKPLTLISTWDGDDMSMARAYDHLLAMSSEKTLEGVCAFEEWMKSIGSQGLGMWHGIKLKDRETLFLCQKKALDLGILFGSGFDHTLMVCPKPDARPEQLAEVKGCLEKLKAYF